MPDRSTLQTGAAGCEERHSPAQPGTWRIVASSASRYVELSSSPWKKHGIIVSSPVQPLSAVVAEGLILTLKAAAATRTYRKGCIVFTVGGATAAMCNRHAETVGQLLASGIDLRLSAGIAGCVTGLSHSKVIVTAMYMV